MRESEETSQVTTGERNDDMFGSPSPLRPGFKSKRQCERRNGNWTLSTVWDSEISQAFGSTNMVAESSSSCVCSPSIMPGSRKRKTPPAVTAGERNDDKLLRSQSPFSPNFMRQGEWGNRKWTLSTVWNSEIAQAFGSGNMVDGEIPMSRKKLQDVFNATMQKLSNRFSPVQKNSFVVIVNEINSPSCADKILLSTRSFMYNWLSNRIEINVQFLPYQEDTLVQEPGSRSPSPPTPPHKAKLLAFGELAQLLAIKVELNDLLIISGYDLSLLIGQPRIYLNRNTVEENNNDRKDADSSLDIVHYPFQWNKENLAITMMEQIEPHPQKLDYFRFTYNSCLAHQQGKEPFLKQVILYRSYSLLDYMETKKNKHRGRPELFGNPFLSNSHEALGVYGGKRRSALGVLDYETEQIEKPWNEKLTAQSTFIAPVKVLVCLAMILLTVLICYMDPRLVNKLY